MYYFCIGTHTDCIILLQYCYNYYKFYMIIIFFNKTEKSKFRINKYCYAIEKIK